MSKRYLRAREQEAWMRLLVLSSELLRCLPDAEEWFRETGIWAQIKGADGIIVSALRKASASIDEKQYRLMSARVKHAYVWVGQKPVGRMGEHVTVAVDDLNEICANLARDTCTMCFKDSNEQRTCTLRKALENVPHHVKDSNVGGCPFAICEKEEEK